MNHLETFWLKTFIIAQRLEVNQIFTFQDQMTVNKSHETAECFVYFIFNVTYLTLLNHAKSNIFKF